MFLFIDVHLWLLCNFVVFRWDIEFRNKWLYVTVMIRVVFICSIYSGKCVTENSFFLDMKNFYVTLVGICLTSIQTFYFLILEEMFLLAQPFVFWIIRYFCCLNEILSFETSVYSWLLWIVFSELYHIFPNVCNRKYISFGYGKFACHYHRSLLNVYSN